MSDTADRWIKEEERFRVQKNSFCAEYPLRSDFTAQVVIPRDMTAQEAARMYRFIMALAQPPLGEKP